MVVFVILHYLAEDMTAQCVDNINNIFKGEQYHILIVDNGSNNNSGLNLKSKYEKNKSCTIILNDQNLGFARGNNIGYKYAKEHFKPEYIVVMNNDVLIEDNQFINKIKKIYTETHFSVLGPDILSCETGQHQNPMMLKGYSLCDVENMIITKRKRLKHFFIYYIMYIIKSTIKNIFTHTNPENEYAHRKRIINPVLHGACFIFSSVFIKKEEIAFNEDTFMYMEEDILYYICLKKNHIMVYDSSILVKHLEDVSTNLEFKTKYKKAKSKERYLLESAEILLDLMKDNSDF